MPKISATLSKSVHDDFDTWVRTYEGGNMATVTEAALIKFRDVPDAERRRLVKQVFAGKQARGRSGWIGLFWDAYADEFGERNFDPENNRYLMALRQYANFDCIMLQLPKEVENDPRGFEIHVAESAPTVGGIEHLTRRFHFDMDDSPYVAAAEIATWVRGQQQHAAELREQRKKATVQ